VGSAAARRAATAERSIGAKSLIFWAFCGFFANAVF
jgi:hypothetical protein